MKRIVVIGAGFGGISAAAYLARAGHSVTVYEKNSWVGGRARVLERDGFRLDMGPSWYWMPGEHDRWFADLDADRTRLYDIRRVDPSYKVYFGDSPPAEEDNEVVMPTDPGQVRAVFERYEPGAAERLDRFLVSARAKYELAMRRFIYRNFDSPLDMISGEIIRNLGTLNLLRSYRSLVNRSFTHPYLRKMLEFPVVFLGSYAARTPAMYTLMSHIDLSLGTWYPEGGFGAVVQAMRQVAEGHGARFELDTEVTAIHGNSGRVAGVQILKDGVQENVVADAVVANADYPYVENRLLDERYRSIGTRAWERKTFAPAVLNFYLGVNRTLPELAHHTFFFDTDWDAHFGSVYGRRRWPDDPLFYIHIPSRTDPTCAPKGKEAVFILVPCAIGLDDTDYVHERIYCRVLDRIRMLAGVSLADSVVFRQVMSIRDFERDYNAWGGNAFGLGQTLGQTAWFRPPNHSRKLAGLYYAGQYTVPGTGTTMSMISGKLAAMRINDER
jgi:phytoene desaturase